MLTYRTKIKQIYHYLNGTYTSTLHPRLFYTYIPYQDQTNIP
ncbi:LPS assembly protein LptD, partial [Francisella tularensis]